MNYSVPLTLNPFKNSHLKMKEITSFNQVMTCKVASMHRLMQTVQRMAQKSCRRACQLFCCPLDTLLCENISWCPAQNHQPSQDNTTQVPLRNPPPSTILIVNISNSTLIDCVIGNDAYPSAVAEKQPLMQESELKMHDHMRCSCSCGQQGAAHTSDVPLPPPHPPHPLPSAETQSISIHGSHLSCVIIGDNNFMQVEGTRSIETEGPQM
ncbi:uncharacterized protein si:dkey-29h14.10 [Scomber scombrus]|uniref:Uncharacterized protein si:dkey-29h14.10 n=1 Tax=Scomber scombrus TaxID=13677 RepID=A0AAV1PFL2_SCOSC